MDITQWKTDVMEYIKKYRLAAIILLAGVLLMLIPYPVQQQSEPEKTETVQPTLQQSLTDILCMIQGAGEVKVLLTEKSGAISYYQTNETVSSDSHRTDTVILSDSSRDETGLIRQVNPPIYRGAIILCQGADDAAVRLSIVEAVKSATGLTSDRITVLKMK